MSIRTDNLYTRTGVKPMIAPALVVITDRFKGPEGRFDFRFFDHKAIQKAVLRYALPVAHLVKVVHLDINCADYLAGQPDNTQIFSVQFLKELKTMLRDRNKSLFFDIHVLGRNIFQRASMYGAIGDNISFELNVVENEYQGFVRALKELRSRNVSIGLIGNQNSDVESYYPYMEMADVLGVTTGLSGGRTVPEVIKDPGFRAAIEKARLLRASGFERRIIFQVGVAEDTAATILRHGADVLVCGSLLFNGLPPSNAESELQRRLALLYFSMR